ncbi:MAG TPA: ribosome small subunit-dependent GTPase A [Rhodanobacteraceae bacterium]|nr:ribosome small subunit-dependent GTPase A [Rhodanobacteraceae bacterium]
MAESQHIAALRRIGWHGAPPAGPVARVVAQHRAGYELHDGDRLFAAQPAGHFLKCGLDPSLRPAVGDFVAIGDGTPPEILSVLARRSTLTRAAAGERYERQVIATNIDYVFVLTGLDGDFNPRRIERYLLLIKGSGAQPVVLLTKADRCGDAAEPVALLAERLPAGTPVHAINAKDAAGVHAALAAYLQPGDTVVLVGSSGVGKSTLTNTLLGEARMATNSVRANDSRGRHTTSHRALLQLPGGGCLIDTPGMRELKLTGEENMDLFTDIENLVVRCRFSDCTHQREPGCAVLAALAAGEIDAARWHNYEKLKGEREDQAATLEARLKRTAKTPSKALGRRQRDR